MGNVLRVFWRDVKRIAKVPPAWLVVVFLIVLPSIYTWFNVIGFWNPYENTGNMRVCVVNEDKSVEDETLGHLDLGAQIIGELESNDQLGWFFVDREEAMREVESGEGLCRHCHSRRFQYRYDNHSFGRFPTSPD